MIELLALSFTVAYITRVLLYEERVSHYGPWPSKKEVVVRLSRRDPVNPETRLAEWRHPVTFFDRIRQLFTRCYEIDPETKQWFVNEPRMEMWTCPKCLTFWVATAVVLPYLTLINQIHNIPLYWGATCGISYMVYHWSGE